jgi:deoxyribodipyrimidine photo-lyase
MINVHVFIFRRDLRINDNLELNKLLERISSDDVMLPIFIFNEKQIGPKANSYFNKNSVEFMIQSLVSLNNSLNNKLVYFHTNTDDIDILNTIQKKINSSRPKQQLASVSFNIDYTPFAIKRDETIRAWCTHNDINCYTSEDYTLLPINTILTGTGTYFSVFTPFYKKFLTMEQDKVPKIGMVDDTKLIKTLHNMKLTSFDGSIKSPSIHDYYLKQSNEHLFVKGGRDNAMLVIDRIRQGAFKEYDKERDYPQLDKTTKLSAYLKFGCLSIREAFNSIKETYGINHGLIRELIWREFYACIVFNKPRVLEGQVGKTNMPFREKYDKFPWNKNDKNEGWISFVKGETGFPFIDAAIRMLYKTGFCPNRLRMILAMFAIKDLQMDPIIFEKWFAKNLVDYDPSSNSGGVLWSASTGCDSQPYFRIFSVTLQTERYDPEAKYILTWIPELKQVPVKDIINWETSYSKYANVKYAKPIVVHKERAKLIIQKFKDFV